ncbi:MAG: 1-deoxy-D-xylulose-5-phosphate reductoisomerase [Bacteroidetes bacterium]|nr:1-deoxy-D-xylulose-5-phosphate reductoisomerase [Bacteroidota bacterium]
MPKGIAILGSTGSIGTQTLQVVAAFQEEFSVEVLTANKNADLLIKQAIEFQPNAVVIGNECEYEYVTEVLKNYPVKVFAGRDAICQVVQMESVDLVLTAVVGYSGLKPTISAINAGKDIALANKETLVIAGELIVRMIQDKGVQIIPVDSEHSAIFQCLAGETNNKIEKIYLTASGGPFRNYSIDDLKNVPVKEALNHPNWNMGKKISIDSASMMNKGLEAIEARWLFGVDTEQVEILIHPQSVIHSLVQFCDGSIKAQMGRPDMKLPILYALGYPKRMESDFPRFSFADYPKLTFEQADIKKFRNLALSFEAMYRGGNIPCALNAANEAVVHAFLYEKVGFMEMSDIIEKVMNTISFIKKPGIEELEETNLESYRLAELLLRKYS